MADDDRSVSPVLLRLILGEWLRELREACGLTNRQVTSRLEWSASKLSRIENHEGVSPGDVRELLAVYGITNEADAGPLVEMARQSLRRGWWQQGYGDVLPPWFATFLGLETGAAEERDYKGAVVTGLLQTSGYARAVISAAIPGAGPGSPGEIERVVSMRIERQRLLDAGDDPLRLRAVMDESVLRRQVGGPQVMRGQLAHLADMAEAPNITIQVLPDSAIHPALDCPFCVLTFPAPRTPGQPHIPGVVYLENFSQSFYLEDQANVRLYQAAFDDLTSRALDPGKSRDLIMRYLGGIGSEE